MTLILLKFSTGGIGGSYGGGGLENRPSGMVGLPAPSGGKPQSDFLKSNNTYQLALIIQLI